MNNLIRVEYVLTKMEKSREFALWSCEPSTRRFLSSLIDMNASRKILEIGTFIGYTTLALAAGENTRSVITLDVMDRIYPWKRLLPSNVLRRILFYKKTSTDYFNVHTEDVFDFIFIDADHRLKSNMLDVGLSLQHMTREGLIVMHDYYGKTKLFNGPRLTTAMLRLLNICFLGKLMEFCSFNTEIRKNGTMSGIVVIRMKTSRRVLIFLGRMIELIALIFLKTYSIDHESLIDSLVKSAR